ncbi:MAG: twin-arginine translocation signal domain-containing protein, partial [Acidimicrobiales bacterium]
MPLHQFDRRDFLAAAAVGVVVALGGCASRPTSEPLPPSPPASTPTKADPPVQTSLD